MRKQKSEADKIDLYGGVHAAQFALSTILRIGESVPREEQTLRKSCTFSGFVFIVVIDNFVFAFG